MRNIFFETLYTKWGGEASPRPFYKKSKLSTSLDQQPENDIQFGFVICTKCMYQNLLKLKYWPLAFSLHKVFLKNKNSSGYTCPALFSEWFLKKNISPVIFYKLNKFHQLITFTFRDIGKYVYWNYLLSCCDVMKLKMQLSVLIELFPYVTKKSEQKCRYP